MVPDDEPTPGWVVMVYAFLTVVLMALIYAPQAWVQWVMYRHRREIPGMPGTGGELAEHLLERFDLPAVKVEQTDEGNDHYDAEAGAVRLSPRNYHGKSLTAVAVATHEVGHAIQFARGEPVSRLRGKYVPMALKLRRAGELMLLAVPVVGILIKAWPAIVAFIVVSLLLQLAGALLYLVVLPEEWNASFHKALPILVEGEYVPGEYLPAVRSVLRAAALTYFAGALASIVNIARWALILRR